MDTTPPFDDPQEGATIGRYRLLAPLGKGGMARVYLACAGDGADYRKLLVVKELRPELSADPEFVTMFVDEGRLAVLLNHGNVVQTYETFSSGGRHCIVMEFLDGQPLASLISRLGRQGVPLELHLRALADMLAGLDYAHELCDYDGTPFGVVHRDVSPQNIFLTYDGRVKVVDFGIAKGALNSTSTQNGEFKGKVTYASPEQLLGEPVTRAADIFSAGVMLWEALTGERAGEGETETSLLRRRVMGDEPSPRDRRPEVPAALDAICRRAMATRPEDRYATAADFARALEDYLASSGHVPGPRDLAALIGPPFEQERAALRKIIDAFFRTASQRNVATSSRWALSKPGVAPEEEFTKIEANAGSIKRPGPLSARSASSMRWLLGGAALTLAAITPLTFRTPSLAAHGSEAPLAPTAPATPSPAGASTGAATVTATPAASAAPVAASAPASAAPSASPLADATGRPKVATAPREPRPNRPKAPGPTQSTPVKPTIDISNPYGP